MTEPNVEQAIEQADEKQAQLTIRMDMDKYERLKELADYAATVEIILTHPRGNLTAYANWCFSYGEKLLTDYALDRRGYK